MDIGLGGNNFVQTLSTNQPSDSNTKVSLDSGIDINTLNTLLAQIVQILVGQLQGMNSFGSASNNPGNFPSVFPVNPLNGQSVSNNGQGQNSFASSTVSSSILNGGTIPSLTSGAPAAALTTGSLNGGTIPSLINGNSGGSTLDVAPSSFQSSALQGGGIPSLTSGGNGGSVFPQSTSLQVPSLQGGGIPSLIGNGNTNLPDSAPLEVPPLQGGGIPSLTQGGLFDDSGLGNDNQQNHSGFTSKWRR